MNPKAMESGSVVWIEVAQGRFQDKAVVNILLNPWVSKVVGQRLLASLTGL
jgi:hypothetical protein